jgi:zinc resistance-associated protein
MLKVAMAEILTLSFLGCCSPAWSQQSAPPAASPQPAALAANTPRWTAEDGAAFTDARIAALKAGLELRPEQQKDWDTFEKAYRDITKQRIDRVAQARSTPRPADVVEALRRRADAMTVAAMGMRQLADATAPLLRSLDDSQKRRMAALMAATNR